MLWTWEFIMMSGPNAKLMTDGSTWGVPVITGTDATTTVFRVAAGWSIHVMDMGIHNDVGAECEIDDGWIHLGCSCNNWYGRNDNSVPCCRWLEHPCYGHGYS